VAGPRVVVAADIVRMMDQCASRAAVVEVVDHQDAGAL